MLQYAELEPIETTTLPVLQYADWVPDAIRLQPAFLIALLTPIAVTQLPVL